MNYAEHLLTEMRHRVSNDLTLIVGVLEKERRNAAVLTAGEALDNAVGALTSLALYYRRLYESPADIDLLDLDRHLEVVVGGLRRSYLDRLGIRVECRFDTVLVPPAMARDLGLIVAELVTNAAKHAFAYRGGRVEVELAETTEGLICRVSDDGCGLGARSLGRSSGGLAVAARLADQLGGSLAAHNSPGWRGAVFAVKIPWRLRSRPQQDKAVPSG